jgi:hypothetical protein
MKDTLQPEKIYEVFTKYGFPVLRIDSFDRGNYAEIRAQLKYKEHLSVNQLQEISVKLNLLEKNEDIIIKIVNIDMRHESIRLDIQTKS